MRQPAFAQITVTARCQNLIALQHKARKPRQIQNPCRIAHRLAFGLDRRIPSPFALPGLAARSRGVIPCPRIPKRALPTVKRAILRAKGQGAVMHSAQFLVAPLGPSEMREVHGIFMAINLHALFDTVVLILKAGKAARIARPHIPFGRPLGDPFGQHLARPARLADAKGKDTSLKRIWHTRHRPKQRQPIGRIGNRAIDHARNTGRAKNWHPCARIFNIPFQPFQIVIIKLERKIIRHRVIRRQPMRPTVFFIRAKEQPIFFLAQIIRAIRITKQRKLFIARGQFGDWLGNQILMRQ